MQNDEGLSTKLWLEERESLGNNKQPALPDIINFKLTDTHLSSINTHLKKNHITFEQLVTTTWSVLISRLSTANHVYFGVTTSALDNTKSPSVGKIHIIQAKLDPEVCVSNFSKQIAEQLANKQYIDYEAIPEEVRYLLICRQRGQAKVSRTDLDLNRFPLALIYHKKLSDGFSCIYNSTFFKKENIKQIAEHFKIVLLNLCKNNDVPVTKLDIMKSPQIKKILNEWCSPFTKNAESATLTPIELIEQFAAKYPDKVAVEHNGDSISFAELCAYADRVSQILIDSGVKPQDKVAVFLDRTPTLLIAMLAIFKVDAVFVPINAKYPKERVEYVLNDSGAKYILAHAKNTVPEQFSRNVTVIPKDYTKLQKVEKMRSMPKQRLDHISYIIYTSGTTGNPKGVSIKHKSLSNLTLWYKKCFNVTQNDRGSQFASQGFDTYLCETVPLLSLGASVHIVDDNIKLTPDLFFKWLVSKKITICDLPTAYALLLFDMKWPDKQTIRLTKIGGETCTRYPEQQLPFDVWNIYGPTETTIEATFQLIYKANTPPDAIEHQHTPDIGKIMQNCYLYLVDQNMQPVPPGVAGEILIGGDSLSPGYHNKDELNQIKFIDNPFNNTHCPKLYKTGDLGFWLPDGNLQFVGRLDNQIKLRGYRIELGDIENALSKYPDVSEVAVLAKETLKGEHTLVAYVVPNLDRERFLYQERCLLSTDDNHYIEAITEDISKYGIALTGINESLTPGQRINLHLKLPGFNSVKDLSAQVIWQIESRCGLLFDLNEKELQIVAKSVEYFLAGHNVMDLVLTASAKRSLRKALRKKLPEYMVPTTFVTLSEFPLTFSGKVDLKALPPPDEYAQTLQKKYIPPKSATEKRITEIWQQILHKKQIGMEDNFFDLGGDSLTAAELSVRLMKDFDISVPAHILFDLSYIPILAEYVDSGGMQYTNNSVIQEEIQRDCILPENITPKLATSDSLSNPENILLTGAGGFLGIFMLEELLKSTNAKIYCLIRKGEFESAAKRIHSTIEKFNLSKEVSLENRRIIAIAGDLAMDHFGMPKEQYNALAGKIDSIYHCGAQVNIMASYNKLRGSNVHGTLEVIKFATNCVNKPIHYISTLSSAYIKNDEGALDEQFPTEAYQDLFGGYAISKWVSELLLTELKKRDFPVMIYRSGYISGDSRSGITSVNDALLMLIKGSIQLGYAPDMHEKITILPVNFVSKAIIAISLAEPEKADVYHIDHPTGIMWSDLVSWLNDFGYSIKTISMKEWKEKLRHIDNTNALYPFLPYYLSLADDYKSPDVVTDKATSVLQNCGIDYPDINDNLLSTYFEYLINVKFITAPAKKKIKS